MSSAELQSRKEKGLCFSCDEAYVPRHTSKKKQLYMLMVEEDGAPGEINVGSFEEDAEQTDPVQISLNALSGSASFQTLKLRGFAKKKAITILVDSGTTHNFLDPAAAKQGGCRITPTEPLWVIVADGTKMCSKAEFSRVCTSVRLLPLGGCDVVLRNFVLRF